MGGVVGCSVGVKVGSDFNFFLIEKGVLILIIKSLLDLVP